MSNSYETLVKPVLTVLTKCFNLVVMAANFELITSKIEIFHG